MTHGKIPVSNGNGVKKPSSTDSEKNLSSYQLEKTECCPTKRKGKPRWEKKQRVFA
jgi:hypothetical protein